MSQSFVTPVNLRKKPSPVISIYGDGGDFGLTKLIWEFIPGHDVTISTPQTVDDLVAEAYDSALVFVIVDDANDENLEIAERLSNVNGVVADIVAITKEPDIRKRLHILSAKYDAIYNMEIVDSGEFRHIFEHKLKKGVMRLNSRLQEDEYNAFLGFLSVSADAFIVFDRQKRIFYVSQHYMRLYPKSRDLFMRGTPVQKVFEAIAQEMGVGQHDPRYQSALDFWVRLQGQFEFRLDNGTYLRMTAVDLPHGQGTIVSTTNITAYKRQEQELARQQDALERALESEQEASSLQKQFISMVSHEFRTPLAIVDGNAQILERLGARLTEEEMKQRLHTIRAAVSRTVNMMEAVLSSNLLKTGKLDLNRETFDIVELVRQLCEEQSNLARGHKVSWESGLADPSVYMDKKFMTIILTNLLSNAVKFTDQDTGEISVLLQSLPSGLVLKIIDNGVGIPEPEHDKIFDRFYRASTSSGVAGSGVGLSLVRELVTLHGGTISVKSRVGEGTQFIINIPENAAHYVLENGRATV